MIFLDFETRSPLDLKKVGLHNYAACPATEIICTGYAYDNAPVTVRDGSPLDLQGQTIVAHNAAFERAIIKHRWGQDLPFWRFIDTAALAARMSLPRGLGALAAALHLDQQKDDAGHRIMLKLARPRGGWDEDEFWEEEDKPADFAALREYCRTDVEVMRACYARLLPLSGQEARLVALTARMNDRGVRVDLEAIPPARALLEAASAAGEARFRAITGGHGVKSYARAAAALGLPNVKKLTVRNALRQPDLTPRVREALVLFQQLARSSPAKLTALQRRTSIDGRLRGSMVYCGAERTGRWSSMGVQMHNLPRGLEKHTDDAFRALRLGILDEVFTGMERPPPTPPLTPTGTVAEMLRGFFLGPLLVGDFSQIEARMLAWFSKEDPLLEAFRTKQDPYKLMAARIYRKPIEQVNKDERFMGKQVVLGCGYGMGWAKFQGMLDEVYDVQIDASFAMQVVDTYRSAVPAITRFWSRIEKAVQQAVAFGAARVIVQPGLECGTMKHGGLEYLYIQLPSGRRLYYAEPEVTGDGLKYWGRNIYTGGKWERVGTWGGKLTENVVQATSRDVMAEAMLRLEEAGFKILLTVHDEIVAEDGDLDSYKSIMLKCSPWMDGLPVDCEVFRCERYRK